MRIDIKDEPKSSYYKVSWDGIVLQDVVMADDNAGVVEVLLVNGFGQMIPSSGPRGLETRLLTGKVEIIPTDAPSGWRGQAFEVSWHSELPAAPLRIERKRDWPPSS